ncbi:hypothetical protein [Paraburkholderia sp. BCC1885]|uniref:hypothetical protein n=1 Tax=Paraburkholderia sp. BCC1885 TaxID=2562669 RepID=UPI0011837E56|nr:hypothetical protein [Paraburkholderia sp. BCC1885]
MNNMLGGIRLGVKHQIKIRPTAACRAAFSFLRGPMDAKDMIDMPEVEFRRSVVERFNAQDAAIKENTTLTKTVAEDTAFIRAILSDVAAGARMLCRLAAAWKFMLRQVFIPVVLPLAGLWTLIRIVHHESIPDWASAAVKLIVTWL